MSERDAIGLKPARGAPIHGEERPSIEPMLKFAFALGIAAEWLIGPAVESLTAFGYASLRALMLTLLAWTILETARMLVRAVQTLDEG